MQHSYSDPANIRAMTSFGLLAANADALDAFLVWRCLIDDPVLVQRRQAAADGTKLPALAAILAKMMPAEIVALKQRVVVMPAFASVRKKAK